MHLTRRDFVTLAGCAAVGLGCRPKQSLDDFIVTNLQQDRVPGFSAAVVVADRLAWSHGYGWADITREIRMTDETLLNIGSVSKTVTATAVMQFWEAGQFDLDANINEYLPFVLANPRFPNAAITVRQLLTHRSSIKDGPAYGASYSCGDPTISLADWIEGYLTPGGDYYDAQENFHVWGPGTRNPPEQPRAYSNVGFGLLGYLVERVANTSFREYCRDKIFAPLGMDQTGWFLSEIETSNHAIPYTLLPDDFELSEGQTLNTLLPAAGATLESLRPGTHFPHCLYSFPNYPDGLVRTSVRELARFLMAYINGGILDAAGILRGETVRMMLSNRHFGRALCWDEIPRNGETMWGHGGGDPGIATRMAFRPDDGVGVIMFFNFDGRLSRPGEIFGRLLQEAASLARLAQ